MSQPNYCQKITEEKFISNSTKFTLCIYWERKPDGTFYNVNEINAKRNRKYIDSYDYHNTASFKTITRHDEAFYKIMVFAQQNIHKAFKALIYLNDFAGEKQYLIAKLCKDELQCQMVFPSFTDESDNPQGHVYVSGLNGPPLGTYDLQQRVLTKKAPTINQLKKAA